MVNVIDLLEIEKQDVNYCYQHKNLFYVDISASWIGIITKERLLSLKKTNFLVGLSLFAKKNYFDEKNMFEKLLCFGLSNEITTGVRHNTKNNLEKIFLLVGFQ